MAAKLQTYLDQYEIYCSWLKEYKMIVKLTCFGAKFETKCDVSNRFYRS